VLLSDSTPQIFSYLSLFIGWGFPWVAAIPTEQFKLTRLGELEEPGVIGWSALGSVVPATGALSGHATTVTLFQEFQIYLSCFTLNQ
jgi:hypothetical protein